jgi:hypothetical protein
MLLDPEAGHETRRGRPALVYAGRRGVRSFDTGKDFRLLIVGFRLTPGFGNAGLGLESKISNRKS